MGQRPQHAKGAHGLLRFRLYRRPRSAGLGRTRLETWLRSIGDGPYHSGAAYWLSVRSTPQKNGACAPGGNTSDDGFTNGCLAAKKMLDPMDYRRTHEAEYKDGWNSYSGIGA